MSNKHDRSKSHGSGGILEWFGTRPKKGGRGNNINGGRPVSVDGQNFADVQDFNNEIMALTVEQVDVKFAELLEDMNIPKDKIQPLLMKTLEEKRSMLKMQMKGKENLLNVFVVITSFGVYEYDLFLISFLKFLKEVLLILQIMFIIIYTAHISVFFF